MSKRQVEAIWVFKYLVSHFCALYGRGLTGPGTDRYTKDHLQVRGDCEVEFERVIGRGLPLGGEEPFIYRWPGNEMLGGKIHRTTERLILKWPTGGKAPAPWRMALNLTKNSLETFEGNPNHTVARDADAEWQAFNSSNYDPWLVVVKLKDEPGVLHLRAYLGRPPSHLQHCSTSQLPAAVHDVMAKLGKSRACGVVPLAGQPAVSQGLRRLLAMLETDPDARVIGPHRRGKSAQEKLTNLIAGSSDILWFDPDRNHDAFQQSP